MTALRNVALVGFAQAPIVACDEHQTAQEMLYGQVRRALASCGVDRDAIDYQVAGSADYIDGRPFGFVAALDVTGTWPPRQDLHLEMDAAFAAYYAWLRMQAGDCDTAIVVGYGKTSEGDPNFVLNLQLDPYYQAAIGLDPTSTAALQASAYMARTGVTDRELAEVASRNRTSGARNREAQVRKAATPAQMLKTPWAVRPLRTGYVPPVGESAVCLVLAAQGKAESMCNQPVWIQGIDQRAEMQSRGARDLTRSVSTTMATRNALKMAGVKQAKDVEVIEMSTATPAEEMIVREAMGLPRSGNGTPVINPSGGPLTGHPILLTGLIRMGEIFRQLSGSAGNRAVPGAQRGIAHASLGHCLQQNLVTVLGTERRWS
jgi:acetyl-CoA acetyltransferase